MSATFRHGLDPIQPRADTLRDRPPHAAAGRGRLAWLAGLATLGALCLSVLFLLPAMEAPHRPPPTAAEALSLLGPRPPEPATLGGLSRALGVLERDLGTWQLLVAPEGRVDLSGLRERAAQFDPPRLPAAATPGEEALPGPLTDPGRVALIALAVTLAAATLLAGIAALLLERLLLAPYRALRGAAAGLAEGHLETSVPGTFRDDEAGALARALERFRLAALETRQEARLDSMTLEEAGDRILAAAVEIERIAATAAARGLEASLALRQSEAGRRQVAEGARQLAGQVVVIRDATDRASTALASMAQGVALLDAPRAPRMRQVRETVAAG